MKVLLHDYAGQPFQTELSRTLASRGHEVQHTFASNLETPRGDLQRRDTDSPSLTFDAVAMSPHYKKQKYSFVKRWKMEHDYGEALVDSIKSFMPDVILSGNAPSEPMYRSRVAAKKLGIPYVSWVQDVYSVAIEKLAKKKYPLLAKFVVPIYKRWDRLSVGTSEHVISISEDFGPILATFGCKEKDITVIPNWASLSDITPMNKSESAWGAEKNLQDTISFIYTGTLAMKHNPELLLKLAIMGKEIGNVSVVVTSEGPGRNWLEEKKKENALQNLYLYDFQDYALYSQVLGAADILVGVLEKDAGLFSAPSKVLSYLCSGKPMLLGMPENNLSAKIVANNKAGICVDPEDSDTFLAAARTLIEDPALRTEMGKNGRAYAMENFNRERVADRFEAVFKKLV